MPDSVSCKMDSTHTFTCEVEIGSDPTPSASTTATPAAPPAPPTPPAPPNPAVSSLVAGHSVGVVGRGVAPPADVPVSAVAARAVPNCLSGEAGVALLANAKLGWVGVVAALKAGFDLGKCIAQEKNALVSEETQKAAEVSCVASGGVVTSTQGNQVLCNVTGSAP